MAERAVELLWNAIELILDGITIALRFLFGDPRPVTIPVAGASFRDPDTWARANRHVGYHDPDRELN